MLLVGHTYLTYGPLLNGAVNVVFEGTPTYPTPARCWEIVAKYQVRQQNPCMPAYRNRRRQAGIAAVWHLLTMDRSGWHAALRPKSSVLVA